MNKKTQHPGETNVLSDDANVVSFGSEDSSSGEPVVVSPFDAPGELPAGEPKQPDDTFIASDGHTYRIVHEYRGKVLIDRCERIR